MGSHWLTSSRVRGAAVAIGIVLVAIVLSLWMGRGTQETAEVPALGSPDAPSTSRADLARTVATMQARLSKKPGDTVAAVTLADALLRQARVTGNAGMAVKAEQALQGVLAVQPSDYDAHRMLGAVYLSQHRFRDAIREADRCRDVRSDDAWVYGVLGDAHIELGEYPEAFDAFDRMSSLRPNAASYARASYARELQGDLDGASRLMRMSAAATGPQDPESLAWHYAQLGHLDFEMGRLADARREYQHANYVFPDHPLASDGLAQVAAAEGDYSGALVIATRRLAVAPTPAEAAFAGDLLRALGRNEEAERQARTCRGGLARRCAGAVPARAVSCGSRPPDRRSGPACGERRTRSPRHLHRGRAGVGDFRSGQSGKALAAAQRALRTGTRDREIRYHAAEIEAATGHPADARRLASDAVANAPHFDSCFGARGRAVAAVARRACRRASVIATGRTLRAVGMAVALLALGGAPVAAHPPGTTEVAVSLNEASATFDVAIEADADGLLLKLEALSGSEIPVAPLAPPERDARLTSLQQTLIDRVGVRFDKTPVRLMLSKMSAVDSQTTIFHLTGAIPRGARYATWQTSLVYGSYLFTIQHAGGPVGAGAWLQGPEESEPYAIAESAATRWRLSLDVFAGLWPFAARIVSGVLAVVFFTTLVVSARRKTRGFRPVRSERNGATA